MSYMEIRNLKKVYNPYGMHPKVALNGLDFKVEKGDFICIMGASGSGKTTLVNILSTIDEATHGQIFLNQKDLLLLSEKEKANLRKEEIGFIFQNYNLIESLTIKNNILFSLRLNKVDQQTQLEKLNELTKMLNIEEIIDKYPSQCSGGQQQRAAIARALINEPKIIFAMPYGADSEKYLQGRIYFSQFHQHTFPFSDNFLYCKKLSGKKAVGLFMAISYHHGPFFQPISKSSPPSNNQPIKLRKSG